MRYLIGFVKAVLVHRWQWWVSLMGTYALQLGFWTEYPKHRARIDGLFGWPVMPETVPLWWLAIPFFLWVIAALAHKEAMRYASAARIIFSDAYDDHGPLYHHVHDGKGARITSLQFNFRMAKIAISNAPYRGDSGTDVLGAWVEIELYNLEFKKLAEWKYPRWEEGKKPGYWDNPTDHFPAPENVRDLVANAQSHAISILFKPTDEDNAYPMRGADQLKGNWKSPELAIPPGSYLIRIRVHGKGLSRPSEQVLAFTNHGASKSFDICRTKQKIGTYYHVP